jgi:hypothetical protein
MRCGLTHVAVAQDGTDRDATARNHRLHGPVGEGCVVCWLATLHMGTVTGLVSTGVAMRRIQEKIVISWRLALNQGRSAR